MSSGRSFVHGLRAAQLLLLLVVAVVSAVDVVRPAAFSTCPCSLFLFLEVLQKGSGCPKARLLLAVLGLLRQLQQPPSVHSPVVDR
mmetsp:Transcript_38917/g.76552  ORF Transcript_38917/g.76552 Transcript_38917/m.76552 type:complete len:86 (+) Transcript_38917:17-274(+)